MDAHGPPVTCWACNVFMSVPIVEGRPAEAFKCGWCGAINNLGQQQFISQLPLQQLLVQPCQSQEHHAHEQPCLRHTSSQGQQDADEALLWQTKQHTQEQYYNTVQVSARADSQHLQQHAQQPGTPSQHLLHEQTQQHTAEQLLPSQQPQQQLWQLHINSQQWTAQQQLNNQQHNSNTEPNQSKSLNILLRSCKRCTGFLLRWAIIAVVAVIISSVAGIGIFMLLPRLCTTWPTYVVNLAVAALLVVNITVNYVASVVQHPGRIADWVSLPPRGPGGDVLQGSYEYYTYCQHCKAPKPLIAHHCRTCRTCVVDMDHHCPFINNCVGRGNVRAFLLFLAWTLAAAIYILAMCSILVYRNWDVVRASSRSSGFGSGYSMNSSSAVVTKQSSTAEGLALHPPTTAGAAASPAYVGSNWMLAMTGLAVIFVQLAPGWLIATYYMVAASLALLLALGVLLWSQLSFMARGVTYVQHLKGQGGAGARQHGMQQLLPNQTTSSLGQEHSRAAGLNRAGSLSVLHLRLQEVLGISSSSSWWQVGAALLLPRWRDPMSASASVASKKWS